MLDLDPTVIRDIEGADDVRVALADRIRDATRSSAARTVRVSVPVPGRMRPIDWVRARSSAEAVYWSGRDEDRTVAACGTADVVSGTTAPVDYQALGRVLDERLDGADSGVRYYGGMRFDAGQPTAPNRPDGRWAPFGTYRFVLPRFELVEADGTLRLVCTLVLPRDAERVDEIVDALGAVALPVPSEHTALPRPHQRQDVPGHGEWTDMVRWALDAIDGGSLDKVVLARRVALSLGAPMDPLLVLSHLEPATPGCYHFAVRPSRGAAFVGASPERLFRRAGRTVVSEAVAGTRPRGETAAEDARLRQELLQSPKERREHAFVRDAIRDDLDRVCREVRIPKKRGELALARGRHLHARITGTLRPDTGTTDVLEALHPTPAVGGVPTDDAVAAIRAREPFDRGWYAGPVGWVGRDAAEFAVGLRAGLVEEAQMALFSGAGIVEGSAPDREWDEIEQKIGDFAAIMGVSDPRMASR
ncbi:menaquinone-specific isochorismate synthase [Salinibacter ruber]|uniref:Isochorismate synthase MenF n=1 Tax=Salinibacter ruber TaxID=146919 RepID=A0AAW5P4L5_9BACT|nr:isochorismate synthase [Salinibacter ruber]MCS3664198.1 menaquinone-specific isochorismate synthase [Salinibacter ruber]MCS4156638.1 menaquinone-specific isochorismate synthase [Salinibacter ruber]MCS4222581.1 menaquinone-specific isochorismate synthase [Salinibacter ruber]